MDVGTIYKVTLLLGVSRGEWTWELWAPDQDTAIARATKKAEEVLAYGWTVEGVLARPKQ